MNFRVGFGYDVHRLEEDKDFYLGGIKIPFSKGAVGHSDADVLIHAIMDALLGAANLRDIGWHFSDKDPKYKGIDSKILLKKVVYLLKEKNYAIGNVDVTVSLQEPKISGFIPEMKKTLAAVMEVDEDAVSVKATTTERLGFEGRGEGVSASAVALIEKR
jgi:2-C-methyl-D-erythritol 2,4-cyclodiphosphate synthase